MRTDHDLFDRNMIQYLKDLFFDNSIDDIISHLFFDHDQPMIECGLPDAREEEDPHLIPTIETKKNDEKQWRSMIEFCDNWTHGSPDIWEQKIDDVLDIQPYIEAFLEVCAVHRKYPRNRMAYFSGGEWGVFSISYSTYYKWSMVAKYPKLQERARKGILRNEDIVLHHRSMRR